MSDFLINSLPAEDVRLVYPLVREANAGIGLSAWVSYARRAVRCGPGGRSGIMTATRTASRFPSGMFCYRCHEDLALGQVVTADYFVAVDILDPRPVVGVMVAALEHLGSQLHCNAVRSVVHGHASTLSTCLEHAGHRLEACNFVKPITIANLAMPA